VTEPANDLAVAIDAWTFALDLSRPYFAAPPARELPIEFAAQAKRLGKVVRDFHEAAAGDESDDSRQEPALPEDLDSWIAAARSTVDAALTSLERALSTASFAKTRVAEAQALVKRRAAYLARIDELADSLDEDIGMKIRVTGVLTLRSATRTPAGEFAVVDGDAPGDRRVSPLRDVASMLRSFGYASATLVAGVEKTSDLSTRELRAGRWERDVRAGFLDGYLAPVDEDAPGILPEEPESVAAMISLFETERAFSDLSNELDNRPSWAWIPMRGIAKLLAR
jgi:maltose alpha-D-glucosyltransferase/alpha-amylase